MTEEKYLKQLVGNSVNLFLVNGIKLQGVLLAHSDFALFLKRDGIISMSYRHSISTVVPEEINYNK
jgi:host factor-I protein